MKNKTKRSDKSKAKLNLVIEKLEKKVDKGAETVGTCARFYCLPST